MFVRWNQPAFFYFSLFRGCIFWSLMLIIFMSYHSSSSGETFFSPQVLWNYLSQDPNQLCLLCLFLLCFQFTEFVPGVLFALVLVCVARKEIRWRWGKKKTCCCKLEEVNSWLASPGTVICFLWGMYNNKSFPFACITESDYILSQPELAVKSCSSVLRII